MLIHLTKDELKYMHKAISEWLNGAQKQIKKMKNYSYPKDDDGNDPMPAGQCIMETKKEIRQVESWTKELDAQWKNNGGKIEFDIFHTLILKYSIHKNQKSPIFLSIKQKYENALAAKSEKIETVKENNCNSSSTGSTNNNNSVSNTTTASSTLTMFTAAKPVEATLTEVKIPHGFECPITKETMEDPELFPKSYTSMTL